MKDRPELSNPYPFDIFHLMGVYPPIILLNSV